VAARTKARKRAVDVLFEADQRRRDPLRVLADRVAQADPPVNDYTGELVEGVVARRERLDELIRPSAVGRRRRSRRRRTAYRSGRTGSRPAGRRRSSTVC